MLEEARGLFNRYSENPQSYMEWYQALGFNKDQVTLLRGRYNISLEYPQHQKLLGELSGREVRELINKKVPKEAIGKILSSGVRTAPAIKKAISNMIEIEDAEIVEETEKDRLIKKMAEVDSKITRLEEEIKELKSYRAELQEKIKSM